MSDTFKTMYGGGLTVLVVAGNPGYYTSESPEQYGTFLACTFSGSCEHVSTNRLFSTKTAQNALFPDEITGQADNRHQQEDEVEHPVGP